MKEKEVALILYNPKQDVYFASFFNGHYALPTFEPDIQAGEVVVQHILQYYQLSGTPIFKSIAFKHFSDKTDITTFYLYEVSDDFSHQELEPRPITKQDLQNDLGIFCIPVYEAIQNRLDDSKTAIEYYFNNLNQCVDFKKEKYNETENPN